ncbi:flagellar hook-basal body complex protein [Chromobacterium haemolyticum]|nr:flagellar hook-basal body complex protein [Chromobacterium haemolyticum]
MSFDIALSGINAVNNQLGNISNNIANTGTYGFKSSRTSFSAAYAGAQPMGVEVVGHSQNMARNGNTVRTGRPLDAAIDGRGFFVSRDLNGGMAYSRVGIFTADKDGYLVDGFNRRVQGYGKADGNALGAFGDIKIPNGNIPARPATSCNTSAICRPVGVCRPCRSTSRRTPSTARRCPRFTIPWATSST